MWIRPAVRRAGRERAQRRPELVRRDVGVAQQERDIARGPAARIVGERGLETRAVRLGQALELARERRDLARPVQAHERARAAVAEGVHLGLISAQQRDRRQRGGHPLRCAELARLADPHRAAGVDEQCERQPSVLGAHLDDELAQAAVDVPVDAAQLVAGDVWPVVGELQTRDLGTALALTHEPGDDRRERRQPEALELPEQAARRAAAARQPLTARLRAGSARPRRRSRPPSRRCARHRTSGSAGAAAPEGRPRECPRSAR